MIAWLDSHKLGPNLKFKGSVIDMKILNYSK